LVPDPFLIPQSWHFSLRKSAAVIPIALRRLKLLAQTLNPDRKDVDTIDSYHSKLPAVKSDHLSKHWILRMAL